MKIEVTSPMTDDEVRELRAIGSMSAPSMPSGRPGGFLGPGAGPLMGGPAMDMAGWANLTTIVANGIVIGTFAGPQIAAMLNKLSAMGKSFRRYPTDVDG